MISLKKTFKETEKRIARAQRTRRNLPSMCPLCKTPMPKDLHFELGEHEVCRICYKKKGGPRLVLCPRCRTEKPFTPSYFYRKLRGFGLMRVCRICRDGELRRCFRRICGGCWRPLKKDDFDSTEWPRPYEELAICKVCVLLKRRRVKPPKADYKVCPCCEEQFSIDSFYFLGGRISSYCKECTKAYNKERYRKRTQVGHYSSHTLSTLYHLESEFNEQDLVNRWAEGEKPTAPKNLEVPQSNFKKAKKCDLRAFVAGFEKSLNLKGEPNEDKSEAGKGNNKDKAKTKALGRPTTKGSQQGACTIRIKLKPRA